jgi:predicted alpha/beta-hydrolase family hydrolase
VAPQPVDLQVGNDLRVSGLMERPANARALFVMGHGAGAGMRHLFLGNVADALAQRGVASLRYQFPYMEQDGRRPDPPAVCHQTVRAAVARARELEPALPLIAGGKSFGGRMTSQAQAIDPLAGVRGLAFLGFPLHPPKKPSLARAEHLSRVLVPMLFLQGTRDALADLGLTRQAIEGLGARASLTPIDGADHAFHVLARSGRTDTDVLRQLADTLAAWIDSIVR